MSGDHSKDVSALRTFADDVKKIRSETSASKNTDVTIAEESIVAPAVETTSESEPTPVPTAAPKISTPPMVSDTKTKSAFDYLANVAPATSAAPVPETKASVPSPEPAATPEAPDTDPSNETPSDVTPATTEPKRIEVDDAAMDSAISKASKYSGQVYDDSVDISTNNLGDGTFIQDKKSNRFHFFSAIGSALFGWFKQKEDQLEEIRQPKYTVENADSRVETIKAAAKRSKRAPSADYDQVAKRLRDTKRSPVQSGITLKDQTETPVPTWSHIDNAQTSEERPTVAVQTKPAPDAADEPTEDKTKTEPAAKPQPTPIPKSTVSPTPPPEPTPTPPITPPPPEPSVEPEPAPAPEPELVPIASVPPSVSDGGQTDFRANLQAAAERKRRLQPQPPRTTSTPSGLAAIPLYVFVIGVVVICLLGITVGLYIAEQNNPEPVASTLPTPSASTLVRADKLRLTIELTRESLVEKMTTVQDRTTVNQIIPENSIGVVYAPSELGGALAPTTPGSFTRNLRDVAVGFSAEGEPYIVLKGSSFESLFGGLLEWERTMSTDLAPLFGLPVLKSNLARPNQSGLQAGPIFEDDAVAGKNTRVLRDEAGEEAIVYTFVTDTVVVITTSRNSALNLLPYITD